MSGTMRVARTSLLPLATAGALGFGASAALATPGSVRAAAQSCPELTDTRDECAACCSEVYGLGYAWLAGTRRCLCQFPLGG